LNEQIYFGELNVEEVELLKHQQRKLVIRMGNSYVSVFLHGMAQYFCGDRLQVLP
jgi:hypothetical protein